MVELPRDVSLSAGELRLRRLRAADAAELARIRQDAESVRWAHPDGCSPAKAASEIAAADEAWREGTAAELAVVAPDDELVGTIVLRFYGSARASLGFDVAPEARGRGIATRSLTAVCAWAFETFRELVRLELWVLPGNEASLRVAERAGFEREGVLRSRLPFGGELRDVIVLSRLRSD